MRFGLMNMYPDIVGIGNTSENQTIKYNEGDKNKQHTGSVNEENTQVSIFSSYDNNKDGNVNYKEAKSFNLFQQANVNQNAPALNEIADANLKNRVKSIAINNFSSQMGKVFSNFVESNFKGISNLKTVQTVSNMKTGATNDVTNSGQADAYITSVQKGFDDQVKTAVNTVTKAANEAVQKAYEEAVIAAMQEANTDEYAGTGVDALSQDDMDTMLKAKNKTEKDGKQNVEITKTAFSTYDGNTDGKVTNGEINFKAVDVNKYINSGFSDELKQAVKTDLTTLSSIKSEAFSVDTGSLEVVGKNAEEVNRKVQDFAKKADKQVDRAMKQFTQQLDNDLKAQVNRTMGSLKGFNQGALAPENVLDARQRPVNTTFGEDKIVVQPNGDGYTATFNGHEATFIPPYNKDDSNNSTCSDGTLRVTIPGENGAPDKTIEVMISQDGQAYSKTETSTTELADGMGTSTRSERSHVNGDKDVYTNIKGGPQGDRSTNFENGRLQMFEVNLPSDTEGGEPTPVRALVRDGEFVFYDENNQIIQNPEYEITGDDPQSGTFMLKCGDRTFDIKADINTGDISATESGNVLPELTVAYNKKTGIQTNSYTIDGQTHSISTKEYKIKPGDTLGKIARTFNVSMNEILEVNDNNKKAIKDINHIYAGQTIRIPVKEQA